MRRASRVAVVLLASLGAAAALGIAWLISEIAWRPTYDIGHPDYAAIERQLAALSQKIEADAIADDEVLTIDLAATLEGAWRDACFFGGDSNPTQRMRERGAVILEAEAERLGAAADHLFRFSEVAENESVVAIVDLAGQAHFHLFPISFHKWGPGLKACASRPDTVIRIW